MQFDVSGVSETVERTLEHASFGSLVLAARRPTFEDLCRQYDALAMAPSAIVAHRLQFVVGWRDVQDLGGQPVPFSRSLFEAACRAYPALHDLAAEFVAELFTGPRGADLKNSSAPPAPPSTATTAA